MKKNEAISKSNKRLFQDEETKLKTKFQCGINYRINKMKKFI